jgi:hypothetical protein
MGSARGKLNVCVLISAVAACSGGQATTNWPAMDASSTLPSPVVDAQSEPAPYVSPYFGDGAGGSSSGSSGSGNDVESGASGSSSGSGGSSGGSSGGGSGGSSGGGACATATCMVDSDCLAVCGTPQAGNVWCCGSMLCYTWQLACPASSSSSGGGSGSSSGSGSGGGSGSGSGGGGRDAGANCGGNNQPCCPRTPGPRCVNGRTCTQGTCQ